MLDDLTHPGTGLRGLAVQAAPRLIEDLSGAHHVHG